MPQPLPRRGTYEIKVGAWALTQRPALAAKIALIAAVWTDVELALEALFLGLTSARARQGAAAYRALRTERMRLEVLDAVIAASVSKDTAAEFRGPIRTAIKKCSSQRALAIHGRWGVCDQFPDALILTSGFADIFATGTFEPLLYRTRDFNDIVDRIRALNSRLATFVDQRVIADLFPGTAHTINLQLRDFSDLESSVTTIRLERNVASSSDSGGTSSQP